MKNNAGKVSNSLVNTLKQYDETMNGDISILGVSALTQFDSISAARVQMFNSHTKQFLVPLEAEPPKVYTSLENTIGKYNNSYKQIKNKSTVFKKIVKFDDIIDEPHVYNLFIFDEKKKKFQLITRKDCEDLTENFGYDYNNDVIDSIDEGDTIDAGTILYKSTSYDEYMNYGYGKNINTMYTTEPFTSEDSAIISKSLANSYTSIETEEITIGLNDNDFLLNLYGDDINYKPFPEIGEYVEGYLLAFRRQFNDQLLFDFKEENLSKIMIGDTVYYVSGKHQLIDIQIFSNNEEIIDSPFNAHINKYLKSQNKYYQEILDTCEEIRAICKEHKDEHWSYSKDVDYLYKRSKEMLDTNKKWKEGDSAFSNMNIRFTIRKVVGLTKGSKITGRYGNKSVISEIRDDDLMPYTSDGRRVDLLLNTLGVINRTTAFPLYELLINNINYKIINKMKTMESYEEKEKMLFHLLYMYNESQYEDLRKIYDNLSDEGKHEFIDNTIEESIYVKRIPMKETIPMFFRLSNILKEYPWITADDVYINKWGRPIKLMNKQWVGEMYIMKLKQTSIRGFSVRSTGAIDMKELPAKDKKNKYHTEIYSQTPIRFGEYEKLNESIGSTPTELILLDSLYRSSIKGRQDIVKAMFKEEKDGSILHHIDSKYTIRTSEIFEVILKSLGIRINFINKDEELKVMDDTQVRTYFDDNDKIVISTEYYHRLLDVRKDIENEILHENPVITEDELEKLVKERMENKFYLPDELFNK